MVKIKFILNFIMHKYLSNKLAPSLEESLCDLQYPGFAYLEIQPVWSSFMACKSISNPYPEQVISKEAKSTQNA